MLANRPAKIQNRFVSTRKVKGSIEYHVWDNENNITEAYYQVPIHNQNSHEYTHFRFVLNEDGSLWDDANLFLLYKIKENPKLSPSRMRLFADTLINFKEFCDNTRTDYLSPAGYDDTPTHRFKNHLIYETNRTAKTGERIMPVITMFYEWMFEYNNFSTPYPLWKETTHITKTGRVVKSKDVCKFLGAKTRERTTSTYVTDGEHLRPLSNDEQDAILRALTDIGTPEYILTFFIALESKARKQTILTLRLHHFVDSLPESFLGEDVEKWFKTLKWPSSDGEIKQIMVGNGYDADSKKGLYDSYPIYIHGWLWKRIVIYIASERAFKRREKALPQAEELTQYLFLSQRGYAMYHAKNDLYYNELEKLGLKTLHEGNALDKWIDETLKPKLKEMGYDFVFHFHCLRATSAKNFLENKRETNGEYKNILLWENDINELRILMNHSSIETTRGYLYYLVKNEQMPKEQAKYEETIEKYIFSYDGAF